MDGNRFDALARSISLSAPRRTALRGTLGLSLAALLAHVARDETVAKKCRRKEKPCKGRCIPRKDCCRDRDCPKGADCKNGNCTCRGKHVRLCNNRCVDLETNGNHCGECGNACITGECVHGACKCVNKVDCAGACLCAEREQGEFVGDGACQDGVDLGNTCNEDRDCPFRSFCRAVDNLCSIPCEE